MQYTTNYNLNKPEGTDIVNPLTVDNPNWDSIDAGMYANKKNTVQVAQVALQETTIAITRDKSKPATFRFIATMNYATNMTITVDGTSVTATMPDGSALAANAFRIGSNVLCSLNGTALTIYTNPSIDVNAVKTTILQAIFPVGSIYTNVSNSTNPATTLGFGTWERVQGQFIVGASATIAAGSTGGEAKHSHEYAVTYSTYFGAVVGSDSESINVYDYATGQNAQAVMKGSKDTVRNNSLTGSASETRIDMQKTTGRTSSESSLPPYLAVYMWKRTE